MKMVIDTAELANEFMPKFHEKYAIVLPIGTDTQKHPLDNKLCCLYIRFLDSELSSVIVPYNHDESISPGIRSKQQGAFHVGQEALPTLLGPSPESI